MARRVGVSEATIRRLADGRLEKKELKKVKVHYLSAAAILQRSLRALPFYDLIKDDQFIRMFSMDEAMLPLDYENDQSEYYYDVKERRKNKILSPMMLVDVTKLYGRSGQHCVSAGSITDEGWVCVEYDAANSGQWKDTLSCSLGSVIAVYSTVFAALESTDANTCKDDEDATVAAQKNCD
ncbi:hypothetical protein BV898_11560 [Hypsibius exemplaris]|uniref:Uncharacterized protein n=1 Tax=Hypsibius exemplaris TaxID=2072580 RepID=A0A1W0WG88_HYPEX|nr:hypothetical protein BV898_11560 [Hypsibius exemplaris]